MEKNSVVLREQFEELLGQVMDKLDEAAEIAEALEDESLLQQVDELRANAENLL